MPIADEPPKPTRTERLAKALLADFNRPDEPGTPADRCFNCGGVLGMRRDGRFCTPRCRAGYDAGIDARPSRPIYRWINGTSMRAGSSGFYIRCAGCDREFESKGLRCCSIECERRRGERQQNLAIMAEVGLEPAEKRRCLQCDTVIPKWTKGKRTPRTKRFCSDKCRKRYRTAHP